MEVNLRRTVAFVAIGFAFLVLLMPPRPTGFAYMSGRKFDTEAQRLDRAMSDVSDTLAVVSGRLWAMQVRDSLARRVATKGIEDRVVIDPRVPRALAQHIATVYAMARSRMGNAVRLPLYLVHDSAFGGRFYSATSYVDSLPGAPATCATVTGIHLAGYPQGGRRDTTRYLVREFGMSRFPRTRTFGLCSFEASFGPPSATVRRWLRERNSRPIQSGYDPARPLRPIISQDESEYSSGLSPRWGWDVEMSPGLQLKRRACAAGRLAFCSEVVAPVRATRIAEVADLTNDAGMGWWNWYGGYGSTSLMNALAQSLGPAPFAQLWTADATPPESYARLTGVPMDSLARRVMFGERFEFSTGATPRVRDVLWSICVAMLLLGCAAASNPRRRPR
jgi:hypothetical protein